ncbi:phage holin, lambda family [Pasteurella multocida]|nr:phage holin, lambda family [Pasteurella multocida]HED4451871.1 phage holin, lambda family [Pasteurella multocida]
MPEKNPDIWTVLWVWLQLNANTITTAGSAIIVVILRALFFRKKPLLRYTILDSLICALIAITAEPIAQPFLQFFFHIESDRASYFVGVMIGFIGTERLREFLFKFINKKISDNSTGGRYE